MKQMFPISNYLTDGINLFVRVQVIEGSSRRRPAFSIWKDGNLEEIPNDDDRIHYGLRDATDKEIEQLKFLSAI